MTVFASEDYFDNARQMKSALLQRMFGVPTAEAAVAVNVAALSTPQLPVSNILGLGYGAKVTSGVVTDALSVRVYVATKLPKKALDRAAIVPDSIEGIPTDVIPVGDIVAQFPRPVPCGVSCGHINITAGTIGCVVTSNGTDRYILSNNHVLANANNARPGDAILEPGPMDGGIANPPIARLTAFQPIDFNGAPNEIDAALAELNNSPDINSDIATEPMEAALYQSVWKRGRTTLTTVGVVMDLAADVRVRYGNRIAQFNDQIAVTGLDGAFSAPGDSGSLVVDAVSRRPVGLLFAGGGGITFCNHIPDVLDRFGVSIA